MGQPFIHRANGPRTVDRAGGHRVRRARRAGRVIGLLAVVGSSGLAGVTLAGAPAAATPESAASVTAGSATQGSLSGLRRAPLQYDGLAPIAALALTSLQTYTATGDAVALREYTKTRDAIATEIAARLGVDPTRMVVAWQNADHPHQMALMAAMTQLGVPYRRMTSNPGVGFDCSGLTTYAWGVAGVTLTRQSGAQIKAAAPRTLETAMAGDLMYYPGHVMMYLGVDHTMIHAPYTGRSVEVDHLNSRRSPRFGNPIG